jgi:small-conductance mechanosensitive channel
MIGQLTGLWELSDEMTEKLLITAGALFLLLILRFITSLIVTRRIKSDKKRYHARRRLTYLFTILLLIIVGSIWIDGLGSLTTFLGLASAGIAVALHDFIANMVGFFFIESRKPFRVGDRIEINGVRGDVIDIRLFEFSVVEVGNWVDSDQSTGRIVHIPNSMTLKMPLSNYHIGFEYIWNEVPVLITFESDWKRAKEILLQIGKENAEYLSKGAQAQIRQAARKYLIVAGTLTPTVYTTVKDSGVMLTLRYLVDPRQRRGTEQKMWDEILTAFAREKQIDLAYNTTRFFTAPPNPEELPENKD